MTTENKPFKTISLNVMSGKFRGDTSKESDLFDHTEIWIDQFQNYAQINGWSESEAILILVYWLEGKSTRRRLDLKKTEMARTWTLAVVERTPRSISRR